MIYIHFFPYFFSKIWVAKLGVWLICENGLYTSVYIMTSTEKSGNNFHGNPIPQTLCFFCLSLASCSIPHRGPGFCWLYLMVGVCAFTNLNASANHQWILWLPSWTGTHGDCQWHTCMVYHSSLKAACQESFFQKAHLKVYSNLNHATRLKIHYNLQ